MSSPSSSFRNSQRGIASAWIVLLLLQTGNAFAEIDGFMIGGGIEGDTEDGVRGSLIGGIGLNVDTWLSAGYSTTSSELPVGLDIDTTYADLELDHFFDPVGVRIGVSYWGDSDIFDSNDWRGALYWRGEKVTLTGEYEFRDFDLTVPALDALPGRALMFDANGLGARAKFELTTTVSISLGGRIYDYSVDFPPVENADVASLLSVSRLSLVNSLIDNRVSIDFAIDQGLKRWELDFATWKGAVDRSRTKSLTVRFIAPMSGKTDIEFSLGYDDSDLYGDVTFFSIFVYFYAGS